MHEHYVHYASMEADAARVFIAGLSSGFANLASRVIAPSESVRDILRERGVKSPIDVIPTGISLEEFRRGARQRLRRKHGIPRDAFVVGHIGRLAPEKNLGFLAAAVARFLGDHPTARFLVTGGGESLEDMRDVMRERGVAGRFHATGKLTGQELVDAYHAMDVFAFASKSETQGMVLAEALAAGRPVVALDAPGARETTPAPPAGELLPEEDEEAFAAALERMRARFAQDPEAPRRAARQAARAFSRKRCLARMLDCYRDALQSAPASRDLNGFDRLTARLRCEGELWSNRASAAMEALRRDPDAT
jgi:glycosyltransferase involved in cell wall biosynthesis